MTKAERAELVKEKQYSYGLELECQRMKEAIKSKDAEIEFWRQIVKRLVEG